MNKTPYKQQQLNELLYQALETERGGIKIYESALSCAINKDLTKEWRQYLQQTRNHEQELLTVFKAMELDPETASTGREVVAHIGEALVSAMAMSKAHDTAEAAQLVAAECVVLAETKDHQNWELIGLVSSEGKGDAISILKAAFTSVEEEEDHHLYHTKGFLRELWAESLGLPAVLPPPEEVKKVASAIGAARAEHSRDDMLKAKC